MDKPSGVTSHDVVGRARSVLGTRRVGHAGTLDPMATGLLVLGVQRCTKLLGHLSLTGKTYLATIRLGRSTVTDDAEGAVLSGADASAITDDALAGSIATLTGDLQQVPSSVSAIKVDGRRAYQSVRDGEQVTLPARPVTVSRFQVLGTPHHHDAVLDVDVVVECSTGTYVRALARDLGADLGVGGHLIALRRTRIGPFDVADAVDVFGGQPPVRGGGRLPVTAELSATAAAALIPAARAARAAFPVREVTAEQARELSFGRSLEPVGLPGVHAAIEQDSERLLALLREEDGKDRPILVFQAAG